MPKLAEIAKFNGLVTETGQHTISGLIKFAKQPVGIRWESIQGLRELFTPSATSVSVLTVALSLAANKITVNKTAATYAFPTPLPEGKQYKIHIVSALKTVGGVTYGVGVDTTNETNVGFSASAVEDGVTVIYLPVYFS